MTKIGHIAWKELRSYFASWLAYALLAGWLFIGGYIFNLMLGSEAFAQNFQLAPLFGQLLTIMLFIVPLLTMRLLAEERREGTLEMLLTSPLTEWQTTLGKFCGGMLFLLAMLALTLHFPMFATRYGTIDSGPIWGGYIALFCTGAAFIAFGLFCSSLTESQVVAGFLTFGGLVISWLLSWLGEAAAGNDVLAFLQQWSVYTHFQPMLAGAIDTKDLVFFASITLLFLFATVRVLESRKWR
jgi:ABC-2 type transport system permease protein